MNCQNCGAPLTARPGRGHLFCEHCATIQFVEALAESADGLTALDEDSELDCPCCTSTMVRGSVDGVPVDYCPECRGVLVNSEGFSFIVRQRKHQEQGPPDAPTPLDPSELSRRVECPKCRNRMEVHPYHGRGNAVIDSCHRCALIWFDHGEIGSIGRAAQGSH